VVWTHFLIWSENDMAIINFEKEFPSLAHHLGRDNAAELAQLMHLREVPAGTVLIEDGSVGDAFMLIFSGECNVEVNNRDKSLLLGRLGKGKWVGEVSFFTGDGLATAKVYAAVDSSVLELKHADFVAAQNRYPILASVLIQHFVELMAERLRYSNQAFEQMGEQKLALVSSDTEMSVKQNWLRSVLKKLAGIEA